MVGCHVYICTACGYTYQMYIASFRSQLGTSVCSCSGRPWRVPQALDQWNRLKRMKVQGLSGICETSWVTNADLASLASGAEPPAGNAPAAAADDIQKELETAQLHHALEEFSLTETQEKSTSFVGSSSKPSYGKRLRGIVCKNHTRRSASWKKAFPKLQPKWNPYKRK